MSRIVCLFESSVIAMTLRAYTLYSKYKNKKSCWMLLSAAITIEERQALYVHDDEHKVSKKIALHS